MDCPPFVDKTCSRQQASFHGCDPTAEESLASSTTKSTPSSSSSGPSWDRPTSSAPCDWANNIMHITKVSRALICSKRKVIISPEGAITMVAHRSSKGVLRPSGSCPACMPAMFFSHTRLTSASDSKSWTNHAMGALRSASRSLSLRLSGTTSEPKV